MSQHDFEIANQGFPATRADLNNALQALASVSAGTSEPSTTYAYQLWYDETNDLLKMRNSDNDAFITLAFFDQTNDEWEVRSAVIQAVDSAGVVIKTDDGTTRIEVQDDGDVSIDSGTLFVDAGNNRVGIGTTSPGEDLEIKASQPFIRLTETSDTGVAGIQFADTSDLNVGEIRYDHTSDSMRFSTSDAEAARIDSSGNVGIGTSSPSQKLDIRGSGSQSILVGSTDGTSSRLVLDASNGDASGGDFHEFFGDADLEIKARNSSDNANFIFANDGGERMRIDSSGDVLIGTTAMPGTGNTGGAGFDDVSNDRNILKLGHDADSSTKRALAVFYYKNSPVGSIESSNSSTNYATTSDYRLKENVVDMTDAIDRVKQLKPSQFNFIADPDTTVDGFLAHEAQAVVPEAVTGEKDAVDDDGNPVMQGIDQAKLVPLLTGALQEAIARIETLESEVATLKGN